MQKSNAVRVPCPIEAEPYGRRCNQTEMRESIFNYTHYVRRSFVLCTPRLPDALLRLYRPSAYAFTLFTSKLFVVQLVDARCQHRRRG